MGGGGIFQGQDNDNCDHNGSRIKINNETRLDYKNNWEDG